MVEVTPIELTLIVIGSVAGGIFVFWLGIVMVSWLYPDDPNV